MYNLKDDFQTHNENGQPYSMSLERHTPVGNLHAKTDERGFILGSIGNRFIFNTPRLKTFDFSLSFGYTYLAEFKPVFFVYFGYDKNSRCGQGIKFEYSLKGQMTVSLVTLDKLKISPLESVTFDDFNIDEKDQLDLSLTLLNGEITGNLFGRKFAFKTDVGAGYIAIDRKNFIGELILYNFEIKSQDCFAEEEIVKETTVEIPMTEGGDIPYLFTYKVIRIDERVYLDVVLSGGTASRKLNREDRPGQYTTQKDKLVSPFAVIRNGKKESKYFIYSGHKVICDPNIFWECQKKFFGHPDMPIKNRYLLENFEINESTTISYGYEFLGCVGFYGQSGGPCEHIFTLLGEHIYSGEALSESFYELLSPKDKFATTLIPKDSYKYEDIIHHLETNHYFHVGEEISLTMMMRTKLDMSAISIKAEIKDVYDREIVRETDVKITFGEWMYGYGEIKAEVKTAPLELGLYRISFDIYYGDKEYSRYVKVFEVFDKDADVSPAVASGLPYIFSQINEQKWVMSNTFDLWSPKPSCDAEHFISCVTIIPRDASVMRIWEVIKPFKREWYTWIGLRTTQDWSIESNIETIKNADYVYIPAKTESFPLRNDLYLVKTYQNPKFREYLHEFIRENPEICKDLLYKIPKEEKTAYVIEKEVRNIETLPDYKAFTYEELNDLMQKCGPKWTRFALSKILEGFKEQNKELAKVNPKIRRSSYGPFTNYVAPTLSYHTIKAYGNLPYESLSEDVYTGFCIFEDYPANCAYQTYRGAFAVMTILLHSPNLRIYPEQYKGGGGGCLDGAVKFAHAPMGTYIMPLYFNSTHAFEFVYNTPKRTEDGYSYWNTYGFHRRDHAAKMLDEEIRGWYEATKIKPSKPLRSMAMVTEFYDEEDIYSDEIVSLHGHTNLSNVSEDALGYVYECARESGLNAPFALKFDTLKTLSVDECDVLVLPTLRYCTEEAKKEIRRLYSEGVSLVATSHIDGLEDIFKVKSDGKVYYSNALVADGETEDIYPFDTEFKYASDGAQILMTNQKGVPVIMKADRAVLINAHISRLGYECFEGAEGKARKNISRLMRKTVSEALCSVSNPLIKGENVGITIFESTKGTRHVLCIDYSEYTNNISDEKMAIVKFNGKIKDITADRELIKVKDASGNIKEVRFCIKFHESVMLNIL